MDVAYTATILTVSDFCQSKNEHVELRLAQAFTHLSLNTATPLKYSQLKPVIQFKCAS